MYNFKEANVTRNSKGKFTGHRASEPGFSIDGLSPHQPGPDSEVARAAARRAREQGRASALLKEAYPNVVAARFVDIGSEHLVSPGGERWPNPDYVDQSGVSPYARRNFELRDVLLADGSVADEDNQPQFTDDPSVERRADTFAEYAAQAFDAEQDPYEHKPFEEPLYMDHLTNQHIWFHQLIEDAPPRELRVDQSGGYFDADTDRHVTDATEEEKAALGDRTPEAIESTPTPRRWNPFRRR
jgi:hypothetical protein